MPAQTKLVTYDDYRTLPDDGKRYEIIGGELIMRGSPRIIHQIISLNLASKLHSFVSEHNLGRILEASTDVVLSMTDVVQPDILFVSKERSHIITENNIVAAPDLVVEILSESTKVRDKTTKKTLYEKYRAKEYWLIYPVEEKIEQFILQNEQLALNETFEKTDTLSTKVIPGFSVSLTEIFAT
jgi:Uma2 family endonuclease